MDEKEAFKLELLHYKDKYVIVEGIKDKVSLENFGFKKIIILKSRPLFVIIEEIAMLTEEVVLLVDLDREGKKIYSVLNSGLQHLGVKVDNRLREYIFKNTKLRQIEGITRYLNE